MYAQLNVTGRAIKVGALTITGTFAGEMEPTDRVSEEETPGVWCADGSVFFEYRGREYSQDFSAAWFDDGTLDYWDDDASLKVYSESDGGMIEATGAECAAIERAANGPAALHMAILSAQRAAAEAAKADALAFLKQCTKEGEA
nr:MAG TPA: hypothetical protein [Caudoviricetes sp.]